MGERRLAPQHGRIAAASLLVAAAWLAGPAAAAPEPALLCADEHGATLDVPTNELTATPVNTSDELLSDHLLRPRVDATAREVFAEDGADDDATSDDDSGDAPREPVSRSVPEGQATPYRRQMYRRDI